MKTLLNIFFVFIALVIVLFLAGFIAIHFMIRPAYLKRVVTEQFYARTGQQIDIKHIDLSLFPSLEVQIDNATVANALGFGSKPFATLQHASTGIRLLPLLHDRLITDGLDIEGLTVNLVVNSQGLSNWSQFIKRSRAIPTTPSAAATSTSPGDFEFDLPYTKINNVNIHYTNLPAKQQFTVSHLNLHTGRIQNNTPFNFSFSGVYANTAPSTTIKFSTTGQMALALDQQRYQLINTELSSTITDASGKKVIELSGVNATCLLDKNLIIIDPITAHLFGGNFTGKVQIKQMSGGNGWSLSGNIAQIQLQNLLQSLYQINDMTGTGTMQFSLTTRGDTSPQFIQNLNGSGSVLLSNVQFQGFDISYLYQSAMALINKKLPTSFPKQAYTEFGQVMGRYTIQNGVMNLQHFTLSAPIMQAVASGQANLNSQQLNITLGVTPKSSGTTIPFSVTGSFAHPQVVPNLSGLLETQVKQQLQNKIDDITNNKVLKSKLKELGGLFGN